MNRHSVSNNVIKVTRTVTLKFSNQLSCIYRIYLFIWVYLFNLEFIYLI